MIKTIHSINQCFSSGVLVETVSLSTGLLKNKSLEPTPLIQRLFSEGQKD